MSFDVIMDQINRVESSKLRLCLRFIYSVVVGLVVSNLSKGKLRWNKSLGVLSSLLTFYIAKLVPAGSDTNEEDMAT
jgi:hypothetical protein